MTQLRTDTAALELLKQGEAYQHGALQASYGKIDPNGPIPDPDPFAYDVYFLVAESTYHQPEGVSRQAISQHS